MVIARGDVWLAAQDPQRGRRIPITRPCVVVSPPEMHDELREVIVAPLAASGGAAPFRIPLRFRGQDGLVLLDQVRAIDKLHLVRRLGKISPQTLRSALLALQHTFAP